MEKIIVFIVIVIAAYLILERLKQLFEKTKLTKEQKECIHEWYKLHPSRKASSFSIYCPKCKLSKIIDECNWSRMQLDNEYEERSNK